VSIGRLLRNSFAVLCLLLAAAGAAAVIGAVREYQTVNELTLRNQPLLVANVELREDVATAQAALASYLLTRQPGYREDYLAARLEFPRSLATERRFAAMDVLGLIYEQDKASTAWFISASKAINLPAGDARASQLVGASASTLATFFTANEEVQADLDNDSSHLVAADRGSLTVGLAVSSAALLGALAIMLAGSFYVMRSITSPLLALTAALRRLAGGEHAARAEVAGALEVHEAARSVNALADESDRLRAEEAEHTRLRARARDAGIRIREHLSADDVIHEACTAIEENLDCDLAFMHLVRDGRLSPPENRAVELPLPPGFLTDLPRDLSWANELLRNHASLVIQDLRGEEGKVVPPVVREPLLRLGVVSHILTPFGLGNELVGVISGERLTAGRRWTAAEVDAFESIAGDIRRGLQHARQYEAENRLVAELKALDRAKSDFLATVSHELRTPLTSIAGYVELLRDQDAGPVNADQDRMLDTIGRNAARLRILIEHVLTLSKIELIAVDAPRHPVNLTGIIAAAVAAIRPAADTGGLMVTAECPDGDLIVGGDAHLLDSILMNLMSNAVKYTPPGGRVTLTATCTEDWAVITVTDTGIGIPDQDQKNLFKRFFRASNAVKRSLPGTGLGLSVVRTITESHGGEIQVRSKEDAGTTVTVRLPLYRRRASAAAAVAGSSAAPA
jgi:signal transduction histidine kinase/CHASE3 domain sensor protein